MYKEEIVNKPGQVAAYYDKWTDLYMETYGDTIQSCRTLNLPDLHKHTMESALLRNGQRILDAGCGVCGPAIYFAKNLDIKIDAISVSPVQVAKANERIKAEGLDKKINLICDDFYNADKYFAPETFDRVIFISR